MSEKTYEPRKQKILVADDSEFNRMILMDMLGDDYEIIQVEDGWQAVRVFEEQGPKIDLLLLDIVMPGLDGFGVLKLMNQRHWIEHTPVIMISAENNSHFVREAYLKGAIDYISRPFDAVVVHRKVVNTLVLYAKQKRLVELVEEQVYERVRSSNLMVNVLSHIVEFRNNESGQHVLHIRVMTELLCRALVQNAGTGMEMTQEEIELISTASALHDIGKITVPEEILNKPGRLTQEEFQVIKGHSAAGATMLKGLTDFAEEPLVKVAHDICRWHHERWDGRGYPDGLKGEEIPISAQIVSVADVYDALTSERCYKKAFSHEKAVEMILNGECGVFNPMLMDCLREESERLKKKLQEESLVYMDDSSAKSKVEALLGNDDFF